MRSLAIALGFCAVLGIAATLPARSAAPVDPVTLVDPFIGTGGIGGPYEGVTADFPGASAPFGMLNWSPDTPTQPTSSGYWYHDTAITGFSLTHVAGAGCQIFGDFDMLPTVGTVSGPARPQPFSHFDEQASPGYYAVTLGEPAIRAQLAATPRSGLGAFTFPAGSQANLLIDVSSDQAGVTASSFQVVGPNEIAGSASSGAFCGMPNTFTVYFDAQFDRPFSAHGTWQGATVTHGSNASSGTKAGGWVSFDTSQGTTVRVKVAVSYVSIEGARKNIAAEGSTWDIARVRNATAAAWRALLGEVQIAGNTAAEQRMFYTALYHTFQDPNLFSDADGSYRGFDGAVHQTAPGHPQYANFSGWDTYRTTMPLQALLAPGPSSDMIESLVHDAQQGGWLPRWPVANGYTGVMGGDSPDALIASAYAFGARDFEHRAALDAMVKGATDTTSPPGQGWYIERPDLAEYLNQGYVTNVHTNSVSPVPNGASETLEYAINDFSIAQLARALGDHTTYAGFIRRAGTWTKLFNTATGLIAPRASDGAFMQTPLTPDGQSGFQEGNAWQYTWMVPQSMGVLVKAMGGPAATVAKLDAFFSSANAGPAYPFAWLGNQPTFGSNLVYLWAGAPYRAQLVTHEMLTAVYTPSVDGIPGNDDLASMSAWWAWSAMGMYPANVSVRDLELTTPLFSRITIRVPHGPHIAISAPGAGDGVAYVQSLRVNGRASDRAWLSLPESGTLRMDYTVARTPNVAWAAKPEDAPPTYVAQTAQIPPGTAAALQLSPQRITLSPRDDTSLDFSLSNATGTRAERATWTAAAIPGLTLQPSHGTVSAPAFGVKHVHVNVTATSDLPSGLYDVDIAGLTSQGALLTHIGAVVHVTHPGDVEHFLYAANYSDGTVTPIDPRTRAFGNPIAVGKSPGDLAVSPDGARVYVANQGSNDVSVIDTATQDVIGVVKVGHVPAGIRVSPDGSTIWVSNNGDGTVQAIDAKTLTVSTPIAVGSSPEQVAISPDGATVFVVNQGSNSVTPIDARTHAAKAAIAVGSHPFGAVVSRDGTRLYVDNSNDGTVNVINTAHGTTIATVRVGRVPQGLALSPDGSLLYVTNSGAGTLTPVDARTNAALAPITVGNGPFDVTFTSDGKTALVVDSGDNHALPIDVATGKTAKPIPMGNFPIAVTH